MVEPYWTDGRVSLYHGDCRDILPALGVTADCIVADPPYSETSLEWDRWPDGWLDVAAKHARSLWCFGTLRMYLERGGEFQIARWKLSQDVIWEKHNGSGPSSSDRFRRVHEQPTHWYQGPWSAVYHRAPLTAATPEQVARNGTASRIRTTSAQRGTYGVKAWIDDGTRIMRSVIYAKSMKGSAINETEKPSPLLLPLIEYACPPGGLVIEAFAGSCSAMVTARASGRRAIGIELREPQAEKAANRLSQMILEAS